MVYEIPMVENYGNGFYKITTVSATVSTTTPTVTTRFLHTLPTIGLPTILPLAKAVKRQKDFPICGRTTTRFGKQWLRAWAAQGNPNIRHVLRVPEFTPRRFALSLLIVQSLTREFLSTPQET